MSTLTRDERSLSPSSVERGVRVSNPWDLSSRIESVGSALVQISSMPSQRSGLPTGLLYSLCVLPFDGFQTQEKQATDPIQTEVSSFTKCGTGEAMENHTS